MTEFKAFAALALFILASCTPPELLSGTFRAGRRHARRLAGRG